MGLTSEKSKWCWLWISRHFKLTRSLTSDGCLGKLRLIEYLESEKVLVYQNWLDAWQIEVSKKLSLANGCSSEVKVDLRLNKWKSYQVKMIMSLESISGMGLTMSLNVWTLVLVRSCIVV